MWREKMLYIVYANPSIGVRKKIIAQCRAFQKVFRRAYYTLYCGQMLYLLQEEQVIDKEFANTKKMCNEILLQWTEKYNINKIYIRYIVSDIWFIEFLEELKNRNVKCVLEFPTYPYDGEDWRKKVIEDNYYREQMYQFVGRCTTYANYEKIFDIPCIPLVNGIDICEHKVKEVTHKNKNVITLIAVATMRREHGYERIIKGMHEYYCAGGKREIYFRLVGDGAQIPDYKKLVNEYHLEKHVLFHGFLQGKELDRVYDNSDIGIGALGLYKSGIFEGTGIKAVEYCVKGLPIVMPDDYGFKNKYFVLKVPNNDTSINMQDIISFYDNLQDKNYISDMYHYAIEYYSWDKVLEPVIEYLKID